MWSFLYCLQDQRQVEFRNVREKARYVWAELEMEPSDDFGLKVFRGDVTQFTFSESNMKKLEEYYKEVNCMYMYSIYNNCIILLIIIIYMYM